VSHLYTGTARYNEPVWLSTSTSKRLFPAEQFYNNDEQSWRSWELLSYLVLRSGAADNVLGRAVSRGKRNVDFASGVDVFKEARRDRRNWVVLVRDVRELRGELSKYSVSPPCLAHEE
jgi:hypothetical protein